jgi:hypothetical protein
MSFQFNAKELHQAMKKQDMLSQAAKVMKKQNILSEASKIMRQQMKNLQQ